jgi:hypothetical protein
LAECYIGIYYKFCPRNTPNSTEKSRLQIRSK